MLVKNTQFTSNSFRIGMREKATNNINNNKNEKGEEGGAKKKGNENKLEIF